MNPEAVKKAIRVSPVGKKLPDHLYIHESAVHELPELLQELVVEAETLAGTRDYDLAKVARDGRSVSLLGYPDFLDDPHPALEWSLMANRETGDVKKRSWASSASPPILHRKETFLSPSHPRYDEFAELTRQEAELGLLSRHTIGTRRKWEELLEQEGVYIGEDHGVVRTASMQPSPYPTLEPGVQVLPDHYDGQPYLYHWTPRSNVANILEYGLKPGCGQNWPDTVVKHHCEDRVFLSTEPDKWSNPDRVLLRVPTDAVECYYDGGVWVGATDLPEDFWEEWEEYNERLADCYSEEPIPPDLIEVVDDHEVRTAARDVDPFADAPSDIRDALEHVQEFFDIPFHEELDPNDFEQHRTVVTIDDVYDYDDVSAWLDAEPGELVGASRDEVLDWAQAFRPSDIRYEAFDYDFPQTAAEVFDTGVFPAIVLVDVPGVVKTLGDGRGRVNLAVAMGVDELPAVILTPKKTEERIASSLPVDPIDTVYHVGDLDVASKGTDSYEGAGLSVSEHPEEWAEIAELPGDTWTLTNPDGAFLDALGLNKTQKTSIAKWGKTHGYVQEATVWRVYFWDSELEEETYVEFDSREDAEAEVEEYEDARVEEVPSALLGTSKLALEGMNSDVRDNVGIAWDVLMTVYVERETSLDGVWWHERLDVYALSAPRGVIVPDRLGRWEAER